MDLSQIAQSAVRWVRGMLLTPDATAAEYRSANAPWQKTLMEVTLPVALAACIVGFVLSLFTGGAMMFGAAAAAPFWVLVALAWSVAFLFVAAYVFDFLAGHFGGTRSFDQAFALVSLAMIPGVLGSVLNTLPLIGWLLSLAASVYGLVLLYRFVPTFLAVPADNRVTHFVASVVVCLVTNAVVAAVIGGAAATRLLPGS